MVKSRNKKSKQLEEIEKLEELTASMIETLIVLIKDDLNLADCDKCPGDAGCC